MLHNNFFMEASKNVKYTDSYDVIDLSTCCAQLLFRCYYSISSSVDYQISVLLGCYMLLTKVTI